LNADLRLLANFDAKANRWNLTCGGYQVAVGASAADLALKGAAKVKARTLKP
jgi:beta-glucosidase